MSVFQLSFGGKGIRTPDFQLAKLALYQLSYAPFIDFGLRIVYCGTENGRWKMKKCKNSPMLHRFNLSTLQPLPLVTTLEC